MSMREPSGVAVTGVGHRLGSVVEDNETLCRNLFLSFTRETEEPGKVQDR